MVVSGSGKILVSILQGRHRIGLKTGYLNTMFVNTKFDDKPPYQKINFLSIDVQFLLFSFNTR